MVHAVFGAARKAIEWEIAESSDPSVNSAAVGFVKAFKYSIPPPPGAVARARFFLTSDFFRRSSSQGQISLEPVECQFGDMVQRARFFE